MNTKSKAYKIAIKVLFATAQLTCIAGLLSNPTEAKIRHNGKIAFTSDRDGNREIYVMNSDGTNHVRITSNSILDDHPTWSPDGKMIAFLSQTVSGQYAIFKMKPDGTDRTQVTTLNNYWLNSPGWFSDFWSMSWSPDGQQIAFQDWYANYDIVIVNVDGTDRRILSSPNTWDHEPAWSPDGATIALGQAPDQAFTHPRVSTMGTDGTGLQYLPNYENYFANAPSWSPDGTKLVFVIDATDDISHSFLQVSDANGTNGMLFDGDPGLFEYRNKPSWSPDGTKIIFDKWVFATLDMEVYVKNIDGSGFAQLTSTNGWNFHPSWQPLSRTNVADFDGDGRPDISVFRPSDSVWYLDRSTAGFVATRFGISTDKIAPADFDGDGKADIAIYRNGVWWRINSSDQTVSTVHFGLAGDLPAPADYTGDGRDELAIYRGGQWWALDLSNNQPSLINFGLPGDKPVSADYDGDGKFDQAVYRNGEWHLNRSSQGYTVANFGLPADKPVAADYDGDGKTDLAVYRGGTWYLLQSTAGFAVFNWGVSTDTPTPADYDGDGKTDAAVFRDGIWYVLKTTGGISIQQFGLAKDKPIASAYLR